ncbi:amino acid permease [Aliikangiella marina]|uniref:Arginine/agmatine antiporter n=1 Tax=Aliikangiella marina TaxID=1712262 RepID=A0A545T526_9GAMM|nr:amino acid permease [Aliikangiella marina]TQV72350.1 amino acid permease [Aliikangiella marina]
MPSQPSPEPVSNSKPLGLIICCALVVGNMIGSGIFLLPASLASYGGVSILGWLATAAGALMTALVFVRLSRRFPKQGGPYRFAYDHFGPLAGFSVAWSYWVSIWCGNAAIAVAGISYLSVLFPQLTDSPVIAAGASLLLVWSLTFLNTRGVRQAGIFQLITTGLKLLPLVAMAIAAFFVFDGSALQPFNPSEEPISVSIAATAALTLWAFLGIESATIPAENVRDPKVTIPRATLLGFAIATSVYLLGQIAIMSIVPNEQLQNSSAPFADAAKFLWGEWAGYAVALGAAISCIGALNGWILLQGQVPMTAARDGLLPKKFVDDKKSGVSIAALVFSSGIISVLVIANYSEGLVALFTFAILMSTLGIFIPYLLSIAADLKTTFVRWPVKRNYLNVITGLLAMFYCLWAVSGIGSKSLIWGTVLIISGLPIYWWMKKE